MISPRFLLVVLALVLPLVAGSYWLWDWVLGDNLVIPSVPFVANVGEDVTLEIAFVAVASSSADG